MNSEMFQQAPGQGITIDLHTENAILRELLALEHARFKKLSNEADELLAQFESCIDQLEEIANRLTHANDTTQYWFMVAFAAMGGRMQ